MKIRKNYSNICKYPRICPRVNADVDIHKTRDSFIYPTMTQWEAICYMRMILLSHVLTCVTIHN